MQYKILARPSASVARLKLEDGESITCEVGAMIAMTPGFEVETTTRKKGSSGGGIGKALKRLLAGESMFLNHFTAVDRECWGTSSTSRSGMDRSSFRAPAGWHLTQTSKLTPHGRV